MEFLQHIVFINLDRRKDRLAEILDELAKMDLVASRFDAIPKEIGILGCGLSHLAVLKMAKNNNWPHVLILEDDFTFLVDKATFYQQLTLLEEYSTRHKFDVCFLSYNMQQSADIPNEDYLIRALDCQTASGYIVQQHYYDKLIELFEMAMPMLEKSRMHWIYANDHSQRSQRRHFEFGLRLDRYFLGQYPFDALRHTIQLGKTRENGSFHGYI